MVIKYAVVLVWQRAAAVAGLAVHQESSTVSVGRGLCRAAAVVDALRCLRCALLEHTEACFTDKNYAEIKVKKLFPGA